MVKRLAAPFGSSEQDRQVFFHLILADQVGQLLRTQGVIDAIIGFGLRVNGAVGGGLFFGHMFDYTACERPN